MKFECPSCNKVMTIKDEYAGKAGKCPGCGEKITLPEIEWEGSPEDSRTENQELMEADSAEFIGAQAADSQKAPAKGNKGILVAVLIAAGMAVAGMLYMLLSSPKIEIPAISLYNIPADRYVKRSGSLSTQAILSWQQEIKKASGEYVSSRQLFFRLPNVDPLWQEDLLSETASASYLKRVGHVPLQSLRDFRTALKRAANDETNPRLSDTLLRIIEIDRLFAGGSFDRTVADQFLARLNLLQEEDVARWADTLDAGRSQAALSLICVDPFFKNGAFDKKRFEKQLSAMR